MALPAAWLAPLLIAQGALAQDSARLARLDIAEAYYAMPSRVRGVAVTGAWVGGAARFVFRSGTGSWLAVDAGSGSVTPSAGDSLTAMRATPDPGSAPIGGSRAIIEDGSLRLLSARGEELLRLPGEERYAWTVMPNAWSPDARWLLVARDDERRVHRTPIVDYSSHVETVQLVPYPKSGTPLSRLELSVIDARAGRVTPVSLGDDEGYTWSVGWAGDASECFVLRLSRTGKRLDLVAVRPETGDTRLVIREERPQTFVGALDFIVFRWANQFTPAGDQFLWLSERDGWRHLYLYGRDGTLIRQLTTGAFPVHQVLHVDPARRVFRFLASADTAHPYHKQVYEASLDGGAMRPLAAEPGTHEVRFSPDGRFFVDTHSSLDRPPRTALRRGDGRIVWVLDSADVSALRHLPYLPPEPFRARGADGTPLFGVMYKPFDFDSTRRYPVVDYIYAGPWLAVAQTAFVGTPMQRVAAGLAQMGFVVVMLDARGTPDRSKAFQDATYGRIGTVEIEDHVSAIRDLAGRHRYLDLDRVGVAGHSWGGYFAVRAMLQAPDFFDVGYAGAPGDVYELAPINEPNLGLPDSNPEGYRHAVNATHAANLRGPLKIMHGTSDANATLSSTMRLIEAFIRANRRFDLLIMPGQPHGPVGPAGRYYRDDMRLYLARHLVP